MSTVQDGEYLAERFAARLPKANIGKSGVRFKRLADVEVDVLAELVRAAAEGGRRRRPAAAELGLLPRDLSPACLARLRGGRRDPSG